MKESKFSRDLKKEILKQFPGSKMVKIHGGLFQSVGIGDLVGCIQGCYVELECKIITRLPKRENALIWGNNLFTKIQVNNILQAEKAGGIGFGVVYIKPLKLVYWINSEKLNIPQELWRLDSCCNLWKKYGVKGTDGIWVCPRTELGVLKTSIKARKEK